MYDLKKVGQNKCKQNGNVQWRNCPFLNFTCIKRLPYLLLKLYSIQTEDLPRGSQKRAKSEIPFPIKNVLLQVRLEIRVQYAKIHMPRILMRHFIVFRWSQHNDASGFVRYTWRNTTWKVTPKFALGISLEERKNSHRLISFKVVLRSRLQISKSAPFFLEITCKGFCLLLCAVKTSTYGIGPKWA